MTHYKIGDKVAAKKFGPLEHDFSGEVEKVYDNSVMIAITIRQIKVGSTN